MESGGVIAEASWSSFDLSLQAEESEMMAQLLGTFPSHGEEDHQELPWSDQASNPYYYHCNSNSNAYNSSLSVATSNSTSSLIVPSEYEGYYLSDSNEALGISSNPAPPDLNMVQEQGANQYLNVIPSPSLNFYTNGESRCEDLGDLSMNLLDSFGISNKREHSEQDDLDGMTENADKKGRASVQGRKCARKAESKRTRKAMQSEDEDGSIAVTNGRSSSCCTSDNDSNASQESPAAANLNGKTRASRGSATDPQSLYARKRRERINERLKILQNLVPNGTKVDISTMLEEAVHYVKFLQLQIKLLSSDEMWMYAPIAYNGMNIGIDLNISALTD